MASLAGRIIRNVARLAGYSVEIMGHRTLVLVDNKRTQDAWFSQEQLLRRLLTSLRIDLVIDAGANTGQFGRRLRRIYSGDLVSFEPVAAVYRQLAENAAGDSRWRTFQCGLGAAESQATIHVTRASVFSSLLPGNAYAQGRFGKEELETHDESIRIRRLDSVLRETIPDIGNRRIFLKMDTQGYDASVFAGAQSVLDRICMLQSEISCKAIYEGMPHWTDVVAQYERAGFGVAGLFPVCWDTEQIVEYDCVMTRLPTMARGFG
jgi:FkbM family methyltransferase